MNEQSEVPGHAAPTQTYVVYDRQTGEVVHVHEFVAAQGGTGWSPDDMKRIALEAVPDRGEADRMVSIEMPEALRTSGENFRVDVAAGKLIAEPSRDVPLSRKMRARPDKPGSR